MFRSRAERIRSTRDRPEVQISTLWITTSWVGAVLSVGLWIMVYAALREARPFLLGALGLGILIGLLLWLRHRG
jgi:hypothetical protein